MNFNKNLNESDTEKVLRHMEKANIYLKSSLESRNQAVSILMNCASILSIDEIKWLLKEMENDIICPNNLSNNHNPECTITKMATDTYDFLQEHKEIQADAYTSKQLEEMANIDKKFKQLDEYSISTIVGLYYIRFSKISINIDEKYYNLCAGIYTAESIYNCFVNTFEVLKQSNFIVKNRECEANAKKYKWDGENFKEISTTKYPIKNKEYDSLKQHKEINPEDYTAEQLDKMAEIDEKFKQLGDYSIKDNSEHDALYIDFEDITFRTNINSLLVYAPCYYAKNIYDTYVKTFTELQNADIIMKPCKDNNMKMQQFKWDGKNFELRKNKCIVDFSKMKEPKINIDELEKIVQDNIKEMCEKSYKESMEKYAVSGNGYKADIKIESDKSPEDIAKEVKKAIDKYFKDLGINFNNLQAQTEKTVKQEIENYNKDMALSKTMGDIFINDIVKKKSSEFRKELRNRVIDELDIYGKVLTGQKDLITCDCDSIEDIKERIVYLNSLKKQLYSENFAKMPEKEFIELYNKAFNDDSYDIFQIARRENINLDFC